MSIEEVKKAKEEAEYAIYEILARLEKSTEAQMIDMSFTRDNYEGLLYVNIKLGL